MAQRSDGSFRLSCIGNLEHSRLFHANTSLVVFDAIIPCHGEDIDEPPIICSTVWRATQTDEIVKCGTYEMVVNVRLPFSFRLCYILIISLSSFRSHPMYTPQVLRVPILISHSWVTLCTSVFSLSLLRYHAHYVDFQLKPHAFVYNISLLDAGVPSRFYATGTITTVNREENSLVAVVTQNIGPGFVPSTVVLRADMFLLSFPPIDHVVALSGIVHSVCWGEAFVDVRDLTIL